jgi:hypothetical protein
VSETYGWYGLKNLYNAMAFVESYVEQKADPLTTNAYFNAQADFYQI